MDVHCKSLRDFINSILKFQVITSPPFIKLGINGEGSFHKFSLSVISNAGSQNVKTSSVSNDKSLLTLEHGQKQVPSVSYLLLLLKMFQKLNKVSKKKLILFGPINLPFFIAYNMKLANIIFGIKSHSSKHPCGWCDVKSDDLKEQGSRRIFRFIRMQYKALIEKENEKMCAKDFHDVHNPLFDQEDVKQVIEFNPPSDLHFLLGIVNHLYKSILKMWPKSKD